MLLAGFPKSRVRGILWSITLPFKVAQMWAVGRGRKEGSNVVPDHEPRTQAITKLHRVCVVRGQRKSPCCCYVMVVYVGSNLYIILVYVV